MFDLWLITLDMGRMTLDLITFVLHMTSVPFDLVPLTLGMRPVTGNHCWAWKPKCLFCCVSCVKVCVHSRPRSSKQFLFQCSFHSVNIDRPNACVWVCEVRVLEDCLERLRRYGVRISWDVSVVFFSSFKALNRSQCQSTHSFCFWGLVY